MAVWFLLFFFFSSRRRHTRFSRDWSSDVCSSDLSAAAELLVPNAEDWLETFAGYEILLQEAMERKLRTLTQQLSWLRSRLRHPGERLQQQAQRLDGLELRLVRAVEHQVLRLHTRLNTLILRQKPLRPCLRIQQLHRRRCTQAGCVAQATGAAARRPRGAPGARGGSPLTAPAHAA